jgi:multiple sugar transport system substrate-binding protein
MTLIGVAYLATVFANGVEEQKSVANGKVELTWSVWSSATDLYYQALIDAYEAAHPNVKINILDLGTVDYQQMLMTQLTGRDDSIDICMIKDLAGYVNMVSRDLLVPLSASCKEHGIDGAQYGGVLDQILIDGDFYGLPIRSDSWIVFYNKDLFDAAGIAYPDNDMTWAEFDALARKIAHGKGAERVYGTHFHTWRLGSQVVRCDGKQNIIDGTYDYLEPYYNLVLSQEKDHICMDYAALKTSSTYYKGGFYNNQVAMMNMGTWFIGSLINEINSGNTDIKNFGIVKFPHAENMEPGTTVVGPTSVGVSSASKHKVEALDFVEFATGEKGAQILAEYGKFPALKTDKVIKIINEWKGFPSDPASSEALKVSNGYLEMPICPQLADIDLVLNQTNDEIMTRNISVKAGIAKMNTEVQKILAK